MVENRGLGSPVPNGVAEDDQAADTMTVSRAHEDTTPGDATRDAVAGDTTERDPAGRRKAAAARQAQLTAARRKRQQLIAGGVLLVITVLVAVGILVQHKRALALGALGTGPFVAPAGAVGPGGLAIPFGASAAPAPAAPPRVTLTVYEDFRCPYCRLAESMFEPAYKQYALAGKIQVQYHLVDLIDRNLGGTGSLRAGNAGACAQDAGPGRFSAFHDLLYADQPEESDDAYGSDAALIALAEHVPGLDGPAFEACVNGDTHGSWVTRNFASLNALLSGAVATPYYAINGRRYTLTTQPPAAQQAAFRAALDAALAAAR